MPKMWEEIMQAICFFSPYSPPAFYNSLELCSIYIAAEDMHSWVSSFCWRGKLVISKITCKTHCEPLQLKTQRSISTWSVLHIIGVFYRGINTHSYWFCQSRSKLELFELYIQILKFLVIHTQLYCRHPLTTTSKVHFPYIE